MAHRSRRSGMGRITKSPTVGTIEVGRREMIEQIESFPPASDHIPNDGKKVVGGNGEVLQSKCKFDSCSFAEDWCEGSSGSIPL